MSVLATTTPVIAARQETSRNTDTGQIGDKNENLRTNLA